jgi:hypothetical protein
MVSNKGSHPITGFGINGIGFQDSTTRDLVQSLLFKEATNCEDSVASLGDE